MSSQLEYTLENGLKSLKQGDYLAAKEILEHVSQHAVNPWMAVQAQIGYVVACSKLGDWDGAIAVCNILKESNRTEVKAWAVRAGKTLAARQSVDSQKTGFVPLNPVSEGEAVEMLELAAPNDIESKPAPSFPSQSSQAEPLPPDKIPKNNPENRANSAIIPTSSQLAPSQSAKIQPTTILWRNQGRAKNWPALKIDRPWSLFGLMGVSAIALFVTTRELLSLAMVGINNLLVSLPWLEPIQLFYKNPTNFILVVFFLFTAAAPWLLDLYFSFWYGARLPTQDKKIFQTQSQETLRLLQRYTQLRKVPQPKLLILPISAPIALSYGHLPRTMRIVLSQGIFDTLHDEEIAVIVAGELAHSRFYDGVLMSLVLTVTIPIYQTYLAVAKWGDKITQPFLHSIVALITNIIYIVWCLLTGTAIWLNRTRLEYSDRIATHATGNPNALMRALLKISVALASSIKNQGQTPWQVESLNIAAPISFQQSIANGSLAPQMSWESLLMWEYLHPYRYWLTINQTHPLLGDRVLQLGKIAHHFRLESELDIAPQPPLKVSQQKFLMQIAPFCLSLPFGLLLAGLFGAAWQIAFALKLINLKWIYDNFNFVMGCVLIGFSLGTIVRINQLFPELKLSTLEGGDRLVEIITNPTSLPIQPTNVQLEGKLIGRAGLGNAFAQDLILDTHNILIKLHHIPQPGHPTPIDSFIGRQVTVTGWLRRGATPWIDIQSIQTQSRRIPNIHPIWSYCVAFVSTVWGAVILLRGY